MSDPFGSGETQSMIHGKSDNVKGSDREWSYVSFYLPDRVVISVINGRV